MKPRPVQIIDISTRKPVDAELREVEVPELADAEALWNPYRARSVAAKLRAGGKTEDIPQNYHWNWILKSGELRLLDREVCGIKLGNDWQGLMMTSTAMTHQTRLEVKQRQLLYVKYLESAPWNVHGFAAALGEIPKYGAVGTRLLEVAVRQSMQMDFRGRVGLHALPHSEGFYKKMGMQRLGPDPEFQDLPYYEFTEKAAQSFLDVGV